MKKWTSQLTKAIRNSFRKCWRSTINRRLVSAVGRLTVACLFLVVVVGIERTPGTNAFFSSADSIENNSFTTGWWVLPEDPILSPEAGDTWQVGSLQTIRWKATSADPAATDSMHIDLAYACGDEPWQSIVTDTENDGAYAWRVPEDVSDNCRVRTTATDRHHLSNTDESDAFKISWKVVLNEFLPYPAVSGVEFVELYNYGTEPVDVADWFITDSHGPNTNKRFITPSHTNTGSTTIDPASSRFLVVQNYASFYLNNDGDTIKLFDDQKNLIDEHTYTATEVEIGKTIARVPDGVGNWVDPVPTPGGKNDPSDDKEDMVKYYAKACFDKQGNILCDRAFLKELGLLQPVTQPTVIERVLAQPPTDPASEPVALVVPVDHATIATDAPTTDKPADATAPDTVSGEPSVPLKEDISPVEVATAIIKNEETSASLPKEIVKPKEDSTPEAESAPLIDKPEVKEPKTEVVKEVKEDAKDEEKDAPKKGTEASSGKVDDTTDNSSSETAATTL